MKVSVVVALYNTGDGLRDLIASLDRQTMSADDFEVVLVDDGSTDDTLSMARRMSAARTNLVVETIPNSGWPGRPRNVGIDRARGDYIFFCDHDDVFGPRALERMHAYAVANNSDIVYGKVVRRGRSTPYWSVWREDVPIADVAGVAVTSRTVHKLYRKAFIVRHRLRFMEGKVRLEDHEFMAKALARAEVVSILASEPCYFWIHRNDGTNTSNQAVSEAIYWGYYRQVLQTFQEYAGPGRLLDAARVAAVLQAFSRFTSKSYLDRSSRRQGLLFEELSLLIREHFPPELDRRLPVIKRLSVQALRDRDPARFARVLEYRQTFSVEMQTTSIEARGGRLGITFTVSTGSWLRPSPMHLETSGDHLLLPLSSDLKADDDARELAPGDAGEVEVTIRHRASGIEWPVGIQHVATDESETLALSAEAEIDTALDPFGAPLEAGIWDVFARVQFLGQSTIRRIDVIDADALKEEVSGKSIAGAYTTLKGNLSFKVAKGRPVAERITWNGDRLSVEVSGTTDMILAYGVRGEPTSTSVTVIDGAADVKIGQLAERGIVDFWTGDNSGNRVRLAYNGPSAEAATDNGALVGYATAHGSLSVKSYTSVVRREATTRISGIAAAVRRRLGLL